MTIDNREIGLARFLVDRATKAAVSVVNACAVDGNPYWELLFEYGMADAISEDPQMESEFLGRMCDQPGLPHAAKIVEAYLEQIPLDRKKRLFNPLTLKKKGHPASACFYGASFMTHCGGNLLQVLRVMIKHGLPIQPLIERNYSEVERAALLCNKPFLVTILGSGGELDDDIIKSVMTRSAKQIDAISLLVDDCGIPLDRMMAPKLLAATKPETRSYLNARAVRRQRIPPSQIDPEEEDFHEGA